MRLSKLVVSSAIAAIAVLVIPVSCQRDALDKRNPSALTPNNYYKNAGELIRGVNSVYALIQGNSLVGREYFFLHDLRSDDVASGGGQLETPRNQVLTGAQTPTNGVINEVWNGLYRSILRANTVINNAPGATDAESELTKRIVGEAQFLRAWCYSELVTLWGGVPIYTTVATISGDTKPRATEAEVYALIVEDLTAAQQVLPLTYGSEELGRATKGAAQMLLARAYMNQGDYTNARAELQKMISSNVYSLTDNYNDNFREENEWNSESVFEIGYASIGDVNWMGDGDDASWGALAQRNSFQQSYCRI
jgi:hypothetical protein